MLEKALSEVTSDAARREIACAQVSLKYLQAECKRLDRDERIIGQAIRLALKHKDSGLYSALRLVLKGENKNTNLRSLE